MAGRNWIFLVLSIVEDVGSAQSATISFCQMMETNSQITYTTQIEILMLHLLFGQHLLEEQKLQQNHIARKLLKIHYQGKFA